MGMYADESCTEPFNINYDTESPITWLDQGGADHAQQYAHPPHDIPLLLTLYPD